MGNHIAIYLGPYKGFTAVAEWDDSGNVFAGGVNHQGDILHFEGATRYEVEAAFQAVIDNYLAWREEEA